MLMHAVAHGSCANTVRKSALKVDPGRKIPCHTGDSNPSALRLAFRPDAATREQTTAVRGCQRKLMHYSAGFVSIKQRWSSKGLCSCPSAGQRPHGVVWWLTQWLPSRQNTWPVRLASRRRLVTDTVTPVTAKHMAGQAGITVVSGDVWHSDSRHSKTHVRSLASRRRLVTDTVTPVTAKNMAGQAGITASSGDWHSDSRHGKTHGRSGWHHGGVWRRLTQWLPSRQNTWPVRLASRRRLVTDTVTPVTAKHMAGQACITASSGDWHSDSRHGKTHGRSGLHHGVVWWLTQWLPSRQNTWPVRLASRWCLVTDTVTPVTAKHMAGQAGITVVSGDVWHCGCLNRAESGCNVAGAGVRVLQLSRYDVDTVETARGVQYTDGVLSSLSYKGKPPPTDKGKTFGSEKITNKQTKKQQHYFNL